MQGQRPVQRLTRAATMCLLLSAAAASLNGCASGLGGSDLAVAPSDPCAQPRAEFGQARNYFTDKIVTSAVAGGLLGAASGAALAALTGGNAGTGALIGGGAGLIGGAAAGYYSTMADRYRDQETLAQNINADLSREAQQMDHVTATFARLRECRFAQAAQIKQLAQAGQMDRAVAQAQLDSQHNLFDQEIALARQYGVNMQRRDQEFLVAAQNLQGSSPAPYQPEYQAPSAGPRRAPRPASRSAAQVVTAATETIPEKRSNFDRAVAEAEGQSKVAFNLEAGGPA